jgi:Ca2+-binding RTX toxin-like protein
MMKRIIMLLTTMALGVLMVSSVALALNRISSTPDAFLCEGTPQADSMSGTAGHDAMNGKKGDDQLNGHEDSDDMDGGAGNDTLNGGTGNDYLGDRAGTNTLNGGAGSDTFFADYANHFGGNEISKISGDYGTDYVYAGDGAKDTIYCGMGHDVVSSYDPGLDVLRGCEETYVQQ